MTEEAKKAKIGYYPGCAITKCSTSEEYGTSVLEVSRVIGQIGRASCRERV